MFKIWEHSGPSFKAFPAKIHKIFFQSMGFKSMALCSLFELLAVTIARF